MHDAITGDIRIILWLLELTINPVNRVLLNDLNKSYGAILSAVMFILLKAFLSFRSVDEIVALWPFKQTP